jgi:hypothetical protein
MHAAALPLHTDVVAGDARPNESGKEHGVQLAGVLWACGNEVLLA